MHLLLHQQFSEDGSRYIFCFTTMPEPLVSSNLCCHNSKNGAVGVAKKLSVKVKYKRGRFISNIMDGHSFFFRINMVHQGYGGLDVYISSKCAQ